MNIQQVNKMLKLIIDFWRLCLSGRILDVRCGEDIMIRYNNINKYTVVHKNNHSFILNCDMFIYIYSVRGEISQLATNT